MGFRILDLGFHGKVFLLLRIGHTEPDFKIQVASISRAPLNPNSQSTKHILTTAKFIAGKEGPRGGDTQSQLSKLWNLP